MTGQPVELQGLADRRHHRLEGQQLQRQGTLGRRGQHDRPRYGVGPPEDGPDPRVRVLQIRPGVAGQREHPVPVEGVVGDPVAGEVGALERADADRLRDRGIAGQRPGPAHRLVQQRGQGHRGAGPGAEHLAVRAEDRAELDVLDGHPVGDPAGLARHREDHLEVVPLG
jgi:hypothetical protein